LEFISLVLGISVENRMAQIVSPCITRIGLKTGSIININRLLRCHLMALLLALFRGSR
jgi:hypothetical protein